MRPVTMTAGTYYVGDLCYVLHDSWDEVCSLTIQGQAVLEGRFQLADGRVFAMFNTAYGDGEYTDNLGGRYPVDAGNIGCILLEAVDRSTEDDVTLGVTHTFDQDFECDTDGRTIEFGSIRIPTADDEDEWDEDEDYWNEELFDEP
jgi:hypothetical protein